MNWCTCKDKGDLESDIRDVSYTIDTARVGDSDYYYLGHVPIRWAPYHSLILLMMRCLGTRGSECHALLRTSSAIVANNYMLTVFHEVYL